MQRVAAEALGEREGTVVIMDARNGRLRAVVNPRLAFEQTFPPGSAIKPFTALTALRAGLVNTDSRTLCGERYARGGFEIVCSHPKSQAPFDLAQALAYSCNYYFATLGERLSEGAFNGTLASFGFGARTGINAVESEGSLPRGEWRVSETLGESESLLVTPVQLLTAYVALVNGGHLYRPQLYQSSKAELQNFTAQEHATLAISPTHRAVLIEGMRGAVKYGTAARAELSVLPLYIFGKTGTSTSSNGFRTQGWFIGFAADRQPGGAVSDDSVGLAVLVFLKRAHGAQSAEVARSIFEAYAKADRRASSMIERANLQPAILNSRSSILDPQSIRVHSVTEGVMQTVTLEDYVRGVLAAEASVEDEIEALKAQAVISRTFALRNLGRHKGYDFCSTTHCQRYARINQAGGRARINPLLLRAAAETEGEVLQNERGQLVEAYFHAACGGMTANIAALWGGAAPSYLRGVRDDYCATMPHRSWTETIPAARLATALRSDARSDVGAQLKDIVVTKQDTTGRAEIIALEGERRRMVRGWDFKLIVGRALGWNVLKSSRFEVQRVGMNFVFRGSGFGHGLGFCQEGAHVMGRRGMGYRQIVSHYFPGTSVKSNEDAKPIQAKSMEFRLQPGLFRVTRQNPPEGGTTCPTPCSTPYGASFAQLARAAFSFDEPVSDGHRLSLSSEHFRVSYPARLEQREVETVLRTLEAARSDVLRRLSAAALNLPEPTPIEIIIHSTTPEFMEATGQPSWVAAVTRQRRIEMQPLGTLRRRGVLMTTLRHEYAHTVIEALSQGRAPRWLTEGLAAYVAGEAAMLAPFETKTKITTDELERKLAHPASAREMRELYAAACREVRTLVRAEGEARVWQRVARSQSSV